MNIAFVTKDLGMEPLGIMYLSASLKEEGHTTSLFRMDYGDPIHRLKYRTPDVLAYSVSSGMEDYYLNLHQELTKILPPILGLFGGPAVTFNESFRNRISALPNCISMAGECENSIKNFRPPQGLALVDVNAIPFPDRALVYQFPDLAANPIKNVISRRGCKYACAYCFNREWNRQHKDLLPPGVIRYRDPTSVVIECRQIKKQWFVKLINFVDDDFASSMEWLQEFSYLYKKNVGLPFFCSVRPENFTHEVAALIAQAGGRNINTSMECANDHNRHVILKRVGSKDAVIETIKTAHNHGMFTRLQNIIGLPVVDPLADAYETLRFNLKAKPTTSWCAILQAYPGSAIYDYAKRGGMAPEDGSTDKGFFGISTLKIKDKRKVERLHKWWPMITQYPVLYWIAPILIRLPIPFAKLIRFHQWTKKVFSEKVFWSVCKERPE